MSDTHSLKLVIAWALGGLAFSAVAGTLVHTWLAPPPNGVIVEKAIHNMDRATCERVLRSFAEKVGSGSTILWLWAEESTPGVYTGAPWTRQVGRSASPPRPYAVDPAAQAIPTDACTFPSNSLHIVAVERAKTR